MTYSTVRGSAPLDPTSLRIGGVCTIVGAVAFGIFRWLHGDTPGADPVASVNFVAQEPQYAAVHIGAVFAALLTVVGLIALVRSLTDSPARTLGWFGLASALVGLSIFGVESTSEGLALPELAHASLTAPTNQRAELVRAAHAVLAATHGPSLVAISILYGVSLAVFGIAIVRDTYPAWLGWAGIGVGGLTFVAASGQFLNPDLMPGFLIYGVLASVLAQFWLIALAVGLLRRAAAGTAPTGTTQAVDAE